MYFDIAKIDERTTPRIDASLGFRADKISGRTINFNEEGICFSSLEPLDNDIFRGVFIVGGKKIDIPMKKVWGRLEQETMKYVYGARYLDIVPVGAQIIRREWIMKKMRNYLSSIKDRAEKKIVLSFSRELIMYILSLNDVSLKISSSALDINAADKNVKSLTDGFMQRADDYMRKIRNRPLVNKVMEEFRELTAPWAYKAYIVKRSFDKPRGYPGDYRIMEYIYDETIMSKDIGHSFDRYFQGNEYAVCVRKRKDHMREHLKKAISLSDKKGFKVLNIACGSCREMRELLSDKMFVHDNGLVDKNIEFHLLDQDTEALGFSISCLEKYDHIVNISTHGNEILDLIKGVSIDSRPNSFDIMYTIGLADYLPDRVLGNFISACFDKYLSPGGEFVLAHKDISRYKPLAANWFCDWKFYSREKSDLNGLITKYLPHGEYDLSYERDKTGIIIFAMIKKK
ncbi:MAG: hypothetical protein HQL30_01430 [Candidatus Omnitrophica bacterium]|nr:hypothetical protein [Candidatus Omnitrophota bacterium]